MSCHRRGAARRCARLAASGAIAAIIGVGLAACRTVIPQLSPEALHEAVDKLDRPLSGDLAALYRLRVRSSGGLRLAVLTSGDDGRMTVSEPFGSAVSLTAWTGSASTTFFDLRHGCRLESADLGRVLGIEAMPLPQAVRLLAGRLPAVDGDRLTVRDDGLILVEGIGWGALVTVRPEPWRVVSVEETGVEGNGWSLELDDHHLAVPGSLRVKTPTDAGLNSSSHGWSGRKMPSCHLFRISRSAEKTLNDVARSRRTGQDQPRPSRARSTHRRIPRGVDPASDR